MRVSFVLAGTNSSPRPSVIISRVERNASGLPLHIGRVKPVHIGRVKGVDGGCCALAHVREGSGYSSAGRESVEAARPWETERPGALHAFVLLCFFSSIALCHGEKVCGVR